MESDVRYLYGRTLKLKTKKGVVVLSPIDISDYECVQYCPRIPSDTSSSVHYEVRTVENGCRVELHAEGETADGVVEARRALIRYLRNELRGRGIDDSHFVFGKSWVNLDLHSEEIIPAGTSEKEFVDRVCDLLSELYDFVEDLLEFAERSPDYNPYGWDDVDEPKVQQIADVCFHDIDTGESSNDYELWSTDENGCRTHASVISVARLLKMNLRLPDYQRPYKWGMRNVGELLKDIEDAIEGAITGKGSLHYRLGTIIVHEDGALYKVVDGQQRLLTLALYVMGLRSDNDRLNIPLIEDEDTLMHLSRQSESTVRLHENFGLIRECFGNRADLKKRCFEALAKVLQVVVVRVSKEDEAFQIFDSQNARGRALDPHDLLKAYHLRAMQMDGVSERQMRRRVMGWESVNPSLIRSLFDSYLFRIYNWSRGQKTHYFTSQDIVAFKGLTHDDRGRSYPFVKRAVAAGHEFQVGADFAAGEGFFAMVDHYLDLREDVNALLEGEGREDDADFAKTMRNVKRVMICPDVSGGYQYLEDLFRCVLFCYADRFGIENIDARVLSKLCRWSYAVMLDLQRMSEKTVNRYAVGMSGYTNSIPMFATIRKALQPIDILGLSVKYQHVAGPLCRRLARLEVRA